MNTVRLLLSFAAVFACGQPAPATQTEGQANEAREQGDRAARRSATEDDYLISRSGVGRIRLGMTLAEAQRALPAATFARATDGDGAALVEVTPAPGQPLVLWADEDDPDAAIDWTKRVKTIETFGPAFHTSEGVSPGTPVSEAESLYGKMRVIELSEIESRQYVSFSRQPEYLTLRLNYTGIFPAGERSTTALRPDAKIMSIAVSSYAP